MKMLFVHDHIFSTSIEGDIYSASAYPSKVWNRYLDFFDEIIVVARKVDIHYDPGNTLVLSNHSKVSFHLFNNITNTYKNFFDYSKYNAIFKLVQQCDAVIVRLPSENGLTAFWTAKKLNKPVAVEVVGCGFEALWNHGSFIGKLYSPVFYYRMRNALKNSDNTLYVTRDFLQNKYPSMEQALTVTASNVEINVSSDIVVKQRCWTRNKIIFGLIGNYKTKYKGIDVAIKSLAKIKDEIGDFEFRVLGKGDSSEYIALAKKLDIADKVVFSGSLVNGELVMEWIDSIDIYIQPSLTEGLPRALIEAMSRGCLCLGSNAGGIPELLSEDFIHRSGNVSELSRSIINLFARRNFWPAISSENYNTSLNYDSSIIEAERKKMYCELKNKVKV